MTSWSDWALTRLPPGPAMRLTAVVLAPVLAAATLAGLLAGPAAVIWCALGVMCGLPVGATRVRGRVVVGALALFALAPAAGLAVQGHTWSAATAVAVAALVQVPLARVSAGLGAMLPVPVAVAASTELPQRPVVATVWFLVGAAVVVVALVRLDARAPATPVGWRLAIVHAALVAAACGGLMALSLGLGSSHAYWAVVAIAAVMRPARDETRRAALDRAAGTAAGVVVSVGVVLLLPTVVVLALAVVSVALSLAWSVATDARRAALYATPLAVLVGSSGLAGQGVAIAAERLAITAAAVVTAVALAAALAFVEHRS